MTFIAGLAIGIIVGFITGFCLVAYAIETQHRSHLKEGNIPELTSDGKGVQWVKKGS
jgi:hypothetical protein